MPKTRITIPVFLPHSGCPHRCVFCDQWKITGVSSYPDRAYISDLVKSTISSAPLTVKRIEIAFFGGSFTGIKKEIQEELLSVAYSFISDGIIDSIRLSTRPDYIDHEALELLKRFGVETVEIGVQSFSDRVLKLANRGHTAADSLKAVMLLKEYGFRTGIQLLPGLPGDNHELTLETARTTLEAGPDDVRIYPAVVISGTELDRMYHEGQYTPLTIEQAVESCSLMYSMFVENSINVIRMGLHPMDIVSSAYIVAGPYHPALGFMIKSRFRRRQLEEIFSMKFNGYSASGLVELVLPEKFREEYIGNRRENLAYLESKFFIHKINCTYSDTTEPVIKV